MKHQILKSNYLIYLSNALDEETCISRSITSDSPAATKKVMEISRAMRMAGVPIIVLSLGRGRQSGSGKLHPSCIKRLNGVPVLYLSFFEFPILTHFWTMIAVTAVLLRLRFRLIKPALLSYNRQIHYWPGIELASVLGYRCFLDLEDGDIKKLGASVNAIMTRFLRSRFDAVCTQGALLAASVLSRQYVGDRSAVCYGVSEITCNVRDFSDSEELVVHIGGTLQSDTGADLLVEAIRHLRISAPHIPLRFVVTGAGSSATTLSALSKELGTPKVDFLGRVSRSTYLQVLATAHVGLALKLKSSQLSDTTFPSKVIEIASSGMLLISTRISDVPTLFGENGAVFLNDETPDGLANIFMSLISRDPLELNLIAQRGLERVRDHCSQHKVGQDLKVFFQTPL